MKKRSLILLVILILFLPLKAEANYHSGSSQMICSDCHAIHTATGTNALKSATVVALCTQSGCHDGEAGTGDTSPDVLGSASYESTSLKRSAGNFAVAVGANANGHNLEAESTDTAIGGTWTSSSSGMNCADCHNPHGTSNYRNLITDPGSGSGVTVIVDTDVSETASTPTSTQYEVDNILYKTSKLADWCAECHVNYHEITGNSSAQDYTKHPSGVATMGASGANVDYTEWDTGTYNSRVRVINSDGTVGNSDDTPFCMTCHKAHGTSNVDGLIYDNQSTTAQEDGSSLQYTCDQCHNKF